MCPRARDVGKAISLRFLGSFGRHDRFVSTSDPDTKDLGQEWSLRSITAGSEIGL
jgi:hypothetical protein